MERIENTIETFALPINAGIIGEKFSQNVPSGAETLRLMAKQNLEPPTPKILKDPKYEK